MQCGISSNVSNIICRLSFRLGQYKNSDSTSKIAPKTLFVILSVVPPSPIPNSVAIFLTDAASPDAPSLNNVTASCIRTGNWRFGAELKQVFVRIFDNKASNVALFMQSNILNRSSSIFGNTIEIHSMDLGTAVRGAAYRCAETMLKFSHKVSRMSCSSSSSIEKCFQFQKIIESRSPVDCPINISFDEYKMLMLILISCRPKTLIIRSLDFGTSHKYSPEIHDKRKAES